MLEAYDREDRFIAEQNDYNLVFNSTEIYFKNSDEFNYFAESCKKWNEPVLIKTPRSYPCMFKYDCILGKYQQIY